MARASGAETEQGREEQGIRTEDATLTLFLKKMSIGFRRSALRVTFTLQRRIGDAHRSHQEQSSVSASCSNASIYMRVARERARAALSPSRAEAASDDPAQSQPAHKAAHNTGERARRSGAAHFL